MSVELRSVVDDVGSEPTPAPVRLDLHLAAVGNPPPPSLLTRWLAPVGVITVFLIFAHGPSLWGGLFLDDHLHRLRYADNDWSWHGLLEASTVKPDEFMHTWWQQRTIEWHYTRPFAVLLAKIIYHVSHGSPAALHAFSLSLHLASSVMVFALALQLTRHVNWSLVAGLLFVVYSHSVYAVGWLAAQNCVLQTCLTLGAVLTYIKASRLNVYAAPTRVGPASSRSSQTGKMPVPQMIPQCALHAAWFAATLVLWILAVLSREAAVVLPVIFVALDIAFGDITNSHLEGESASTPSDDRLHRSRLRVSAHVRGKLPVYLLFAVIGLGFAVWRLSLVYHPMPDFYFRHYDGPGYFLWLAAKLMHWVTAAIWLSPMTVGPTGRMNPFAEVPWDCLLMLVIMGVMTAGYVLACRRARGWWIWPLWVVLTFIPVAPVMAGPHSGYMAGVGFAIAMVLGPALRNQLQPVSIGRWSRPIATWFLIATCIYIPIYRPMWSSLNAAERFTMAGVAAAPPPRAATDLFFINLPFVNVYAKLHLREVLNSPDRPIETHVLTYAPNLLRVEYPTEIKQLDAYRFRVRVADGRPYFSGALGRYLLESMRPDGRFTKGKRISGGLFDVEINEADDDGVRALTYRFHRPLVSPEYCFYVTTNSCGAAKVKFWGPDETPSLAEGMTGESMSSPERITLEQLQDAEHQVELGRAHAAGTLFTATLSDDTTIRQNAKAALGRVAKPVAEALAAPIQDVLRMTDPAPSDWARVRVWWSTQVDDANLSALCWHQEEFAAYRREINRLFHIREITSHVIRTDMYMTGGPFPSPR